MPAYMTVAFKSSIAKTVDASGHANTFFAELAAPKTV
jgi:hypothetical protein